MPGEVPPTTPMPQPDAGPTKLDLFEQRSTDWFESKFGDAGTGIGNWIKREFTTEVPNFREATTAVIKSATLGAVALGASAI